MILDSDATRQQVLDEFLKICPLEGWNDEALLQAVVACEIDEKFGSIIFENGCLDVAGFLHTKTKCQMR
jgi:ubiquinone biosynthesis protein COQ9